MKSLLKAIAALGLAAAAAVTVYAQGSKEPAKLPPPSEMTRSVATYAAQVEDDETHINRLQNVARKSKDVVKLTCVNDKVVEVKGERNVFDQNKLSFDGSIATSPETAQPYYVELTRLAGVIGKLREDAEQCIGVPELYKQESDVEVTHPDFPDDPTTEDPFDPDVEAPTYASEFGAN